MARQEALYNDVPHRVEYICDTFEKTKNLIELLSRCKSIPETTIWVYPEYWNAESIKHLQQIRFAYFRIYPVDVRDTSQWVYLPHSDTVESGFSPGIRIAHELGTLTITNPESDIMSLPFLHPMKGAYTTVNISGRFRDYSRLPVTESVHIEKGLLRFTDIEHICLVATHVTILQNTVFDIPERRIDVHVESLTVSPSILCYFSTIQARVLDIVLDDDLAPFEMIEKKKMKRSQIESIRVTGSLQAKKSEKLYVYLLQMFDNDCESYTFSLPLTDTVHYL